MNKSFVDSATYYELDQDGFVIGIKGKCRVGDLQSKAVEFYYDDDIFLELGIRRCD